jgi:AcrR family transcriptional regulator
LPSTEVGESTPRLAARCPRGSGFDVFPVGAEELCPALGGERGGFGHVHEVVDDGDEAPGVVELREVAGVLEDLEAGAGHGLLGGVSVVDGQDRVPLPPNDQGRHVLGQVEAVARVHELSAGSDDSAQGAEERCACLTIGERCERARVVLGVGGWTDGQRASGASCAVDQRPRCRGGQREEQLTAGKGGEAKDEADVGAEAAAGDQHQALAALGELVGELHRDPTAERMADHRCAFDAERSAQIAQGTRERAEGVVAGALRRAAVAGQVNRYDLVAAGEAVEDGLPCAPVAADAVNEQHGRPLAADDIGDLAAVEANNTVIEIHVHVNIGYTIGYSLQMPVTHTRAASRRARERKIVDATRALFDELGTQDARIDRIARRVGINKALIYRHFASKEELFVLTTTRYLAEINVLLEAVDRETGDAPERLRRGFEAFADYGIKHPAFLDCALSLVRQPARELRAQVSEAVWLRLGGSMGVCIGWLSDVLRDLGVTDPDLRANQLYLQAIGVLHLARSGVGLRATTPGATEAFPVTAEQVRASCVQLALTVAATG